jgi:hypothetical protein
MRERDKSNLIENQPSETEDIFSRFLRASRYSPNALLVCHGDKPNIGARLALKKIRCEKAITRARERERETKASYPRLVHCSHLTDDSGHLLYSEAVSDHRAHTARPGCHHSSSLTGSNNLIGSALGDQV